MAVGKKRETESGFKNISRQGEKGGALLFLVGGDGTPWIPAAPQPQPISLSTSALFAFWAPLAFLANSPFTLSFLPLSPPFPFLSPPSIFHLLCPRLSVISSESHWSAQESKASSMGSVGSWRRQRDSGVITALSKPIGKAGFGSSVLPHTPGPILAPQRANENIVPAFLQPIPNQFPYSRANKCPFFNPLENPSIYRTGISI